MKRRFVLLLSMMISVIGCSPSLQEYSPDQVIENALNEKNNIAAYYAESKWTTMERGKVIELLTMKEWLSKDGKKRVETIGKNDSNYAIAINDGVRLLTYMPNEKKAYIFESEELVSLNQQSPKEQAEHMLKLIQDTHEIEVIGEENIAGRNTYHLKATAKKEQSLIGNQEIWIDKKTWFVLKMKSTSDETTIEWEYTKIEFKTQNDEELFTIKLPDDVEIEHLEDSLAGKEVTLEEAKDELGTSFLYIPETDALKIAYVELTEFDGEIDRKEITVEYEKDGLPFLSLSIFKQPSEQLEENHLEALPYEETIQVRGFEGNWSEELRALDWVEKGMTYSIIVFDPNVSIEELQQLLAQMVQFD